ncbi:type I-E CRISPR-associated protein Cas5/CasD [Streptacidiphilus cavernicola]|uniref:Type I-E CRISPR-associated protein Cas5/CasD n=1 Tax=Streptacidiphilus cavernicola TaxID=3342716 RepID=A0ABV6VVT6_9ACTN
MNALILRLAGPLQSWGERSAFNTRDTAPFPTRSALIGMLAAAEGRSRYADLDHYAPLEVTVRIDRPGNRLIDFHTVGGGLPAAHTVPTSEGGHRPADAATMVTRRHYLADAAFTIALAGPDPLLERLAAALERPAWAPYLGRRSCVPDEPLLLRDNVTDPLTELRTAVPLCLARPPASGQSTVRVGFVWESPPPGLAADAQLYEVTDVPTSFAPDNRSYSARRLWRTDEDLPTDLYAGRNPAERLIDYALRQST